MYLNLPVFIVFAEKLFKEAYESKSPRWLLDSSNSLQQQMNDLILTIGSFTMVSGFYSDVNKQSFHFLHFQWWGVFSRNISDT